MNPRRRPSDRSGLEWLAPNADTSAQTCDTGRLTPTSPRPHEAARKHRRLHGCLCRGIAHRWASAGVLIRISRRQAPSYRGMSPTLKKKKATADKLRSWRVTILRQRAKEIGIVQAPNAKAAEAAAIVEFKLDDEQQKRLVVQERDSP